MIMVPIWLPPIHQGYYYTFSSLLTLQIFFELGLSQVIVLLVSHEAAHVKFQDDGQWNGDRQHLGRLSRIFRLLRYWYRIAALLFAVIGSLIGLFFFNHHDQSLPIFSWAPIWVSVVIFSAINLFLSPQLAILEGIGLIGQVARLRLFQSIVGYSIFWSLLVMEAKLWVTVILPLISVVMTLIWLRQYGKRLNIIPNYHSDISWYHDVFPLQWRIAVSWICGYFIFNLFTPIVFSTHGAIAAGKLGMALSIFSALSTLGLSWLNAKTPNFTQHISCGESQAFEQLFKFVALRSIFVTTTLSFGVVALIQFATLLELRFVSRISPPSVLLWIACATVANTLINAAAIYMRAHREEPMLPISVTSAGIIASVVFLFREDIQLMMMGYSMVVICIVLPWTAWIYQRYRTRHITIYQSNTI